MDTRICLTGVVIRQNEVLGKKDEMREKILEIVGCPECSAPAEVVQRFVLESTDGPLEHTVVLCAMKHRLTVVVEP